VDVDVDLIGWVGVGLEKTMAAGVVSYMFLCSHIYGCVFFY